MPPGVDCNGRSRKNAQRTFRCCKQMKMDRPCTCAMGNVSRFIEPVVLRILKERKSSYGYEIAECVSLYALTDATIEGAALYRTLRALEANGYVSSTWEAGSGPARRRYSLTRMGLVHLREWAYLLNNLGEAMIEFARNAAEASEKDEEKSTPANVPV
jgi:PadR family transcriptional regulator, regulatory protein PadR